MFGLILEYLLDLCLNEKENYMSEQLYILLQVFKDYLIGD